MRVSTFDIFSKIILEKNYTYLIPEDKELLLYDFYMITHLNGLKAQGRFEPGEKRNAYGETISSSTMSMGLKETTLMSFEDIKEQIINHLQPELLEAALYAISCEIRHVLDRNSVSDIENNLGKKAAEFFAHFEYQFQKIKDKNRVSSPHSTVQDLIKKRSKEFNKKYNIKLRDKGSRNPDYVLSYKTVKKVISDLKMPELEFVSIAEKCFNDLKWPSMYGGPKWGQIAKAYIDLYYAKSEFKKIVYIDNMYHQQHNTNTVFNKLQLYYKAKSGYAWVLDALNFKADVKDDWERIKRIRQITGTRIRNVDKMYIEMFKAAGEKTWQQYYMPIEDKKEPEKSEKPGDINADKLGLDKEKYVKLAEQGFDKFGKIYDGGDASKELVYVGKGSQNLQGEGLSKILRLSTSLLYMKDNSTWNKGNMGNDSYSDYAIPRTEWENLFGSSKKIFGEKESSELKADKLGLDKEKYIELAKEGFKTYGKIYSYDNDKTELIHVGKGSHMPDSLAHKLGLKEGSVYLYKGPPDNLFEPDFSGTSPNKLYAISREDWENLFGSSEEIFGKEKQSDKEYKGPDKEKYINLAKDGLKQFGKIYDSFDPSIELIYIGKGSNPSIGDKLGITKHMAMKLPYEDIWEGGNTSIFSGNMSQYDYAIPKDEWEELFGKVPFEEKSDKRELDKEKYINLAKEGFKKYGKIYDNVNGKKELIYVGKGSDEKPIADYLKIGTEELYYYNNINNIWHGNNYGSESDLQYAITKTEWEKLFGSSKEIFGEKSDNSDIDKEKYINLAKEGFKKYGKIYDYDHTSKELVYVGKGDTDKPISKYLKIRNSNLYSLDAGDGWTAPNYGSESGMSYAIPKDIWEELFGSSKEIVGKEEVPEEVPDDSSFITKIKNNITPANKQYFIEMAKLSRKEITNLYPKYIYMGKGNPGEDKYIVTRLGLSPTKTESGILNIVYGEPDSMSVSFPNNFGSDIYGKYVLLKEQWEQIFGPIDKVLKRPRKPSANNTMSSYKKLANDGYKLFHTMYPVISSNIIYVGRDATNLDIAITVGLLPPVSQGCYYIFKNNKQIPVNNMSEIDEYDDVFLDRSVWESYFGPVSNLPNYNKDEDWYKVQI